jgi:hypothetical protein
MARKRKKTNQKTRLSVQLKLRMDEYLHRRLEQAARRANRSLNSEILRRLELSLEQLDAPKLAAQALRRGLDDEILGELMDICRQEEDADRLGSHQMDQADEERYEQEQREKED